MSKPTIGASYARSFLWVVLFAAVTAGAMIGVHLGFVHIMRGNPSQIRENGIGMLVTMAAIIGVITALGSILVLSLPQVFQAVLVTVLRCRFGGRARLAPFPALPLTAVLTWYCYDYLTPSDFGLGFNTGPDWRPYQHGISIARYLGALTFQAPVTLFSFLYAEADFRGVYKRPILIAALVATITGGGIWGYGMARTN